MKPPTFHPIPPDQLPQDPKGDGAGLILVRSLGFAPVPVKSIDETIINLALAQVVFVAVATASKAAAA